MPPLKVLSKLYRCLSVVLLMTCPFCALFAQQQDTAGNKISRSFINNIFQQVRHAVTVSKKDSINKSTVLNTKSESPFLPYQGSIIRHITTNELGFNKTLKDTSNRIRYAGTRIINKLHRNTRGWVIMNHLFFREYSVLNAYLLSDNERYLRSLDFIQDARIVVKPVTGTDSVDVEVVTKDLFSITVAINASGVKRVRARGGEANFLGMGQRVQFTTLVDQNRHPGFGYEFLYSKSGIGKSLATVTAGYTVINSGISTGLEEEKALYFRVERPLVSPYSHLAGALEVSFNSSENYYRKPAPEFYRYTYNLVDGWVGYNLGITKLLQKGQIRDRSFFAVRMMHNDFIHTPAQIANHFDPIYNNRQAALGEFTLFRQDFYKSNYIYGFGTTEDIPYGYNLAITGGWYKQLNLERPYAGININHFVTTKSGEFAQYFVRAGTFWNKGSLQDANLLAGANIFTKLYLINNAKLRGNIRFSYARTFNRVTSDLLRINNPFGIQSFRADSAMGIQRISCYTEAFLFTTYQLAGFRLAPFTFTDLSVLTPYNQKQTRSALYSGLGGGVRTRNENLVFGTLELRFVYFPKTAQTLQAFKLTFKSNLRFRYNSRYVKAPDIIQMNSDDTLLY